MRSSSNGTKLYFNNVGKLVKFKFVFGSQVVHKYHAIVNLRSSILSKAPALISEIIACFFGCALFTKSFGDVYGRFSIMTLIKSSPTFTKFLNPINIQLFFTSGVKPYFEVLISTNLTSISDVVNSPIAFAILP